MALTPAHKALVRHMVLRRINQEAGTESGMTDAAFSATIGVEWETVRAWKKRPDIRAAVEAGMHEYETSKDYFRSCIRAQAMEELWTNYQSAKEPNKRQYLLMVLDQTKDVDMSDELVDFSDLSDDDLVASVLGRELSVFGMTQRELAVLAKGATCSTPSSESVSEPESSLADSTPDGLPETEPESHAVSQRRPMPTKRRKRRSS